MRTNEPVVVGLTAFGGAALGAVASTTDGDLTVWFIVLAIVAIAGAVVLTMQSDDGDNRDAAADAMASQGPHPGAASSASHPGVAG